MILSAAAVALNELSAERKFPFEIFPPKSRVTKPPNFYEVGERDCGSFSKPEECGVSLRSLRAACFQFTAVY